MAVFTEAQVNEVVRLVNSGEVTVEQLSQQYGMDASLIQENIDVINSGQEAPNAPNQETHQVTQPVDTQAFVDAISGAGTAATVANIGNNVDGTSVAGQNAVIAAAAGNPAPTNDPLPNVTVTANTPGTTPASGPVQTTAPVPTATQPVTNRQITGIGNPITGVEVPADREARLALARLGQSDIAGGSVNIAGADLQALPISQEGTITPESNVQQINAPTPVQGAAPITATNIDPTVVPTTAQATQPNAIQAATIDNVEQIAQATPTTAAQGTLSAGATADNIDGTASAATQASAVTVDPVTGAEVVAAQGTMSPEAIAQAATVAGAETARISQAKSQLRKAGLSDADIAAFANDPEALELRLTDFTEAQRGMIAGLPVEALVSTQMENLLSGLEETGDIPLWARPAVDAATNMLARRGVTASTVGKETFFNAIIQSAVPLAQQNAQTIKESAMQQSSITAQNAQLDAQLKNQTTLQNAQNAFNLDLTNLNNEQQARVANSQFLQTVSLTNASNAQQAAIQNAVNMTQVQVKGIEGNSQIAISNARAFLEMDLTNLNNAQQSVVLDQQIEQQRLLTNAAAVNAGKQFNASSENQINQFMTGLAAQMEQFNTQQSNAMKTFNATEANKIAATNAGNDLQAGIFNSQLLAQIDQFNVQQEVAVEQWNAANAQAIEQSNVQWRRQANTAETAAQNAINQQNVQNAFGLTSQAQAALWQELRDAATFTFQAFENKEDREAQLYATAIGNESAASNSYDHTTHLVNLAKSFFIGT